MLVVHGDEMESITRTNPVSGLDYSYLDVGLRVGNTCGDPWNLADWLPAAREQPIRSPVRPTKRSGGFLFFFCPPFGRDLPATALDWSPLVDQQPIRSGVLGTKWSLKSVDFLF